MDSSSSYFLITNNTAPQTANNNSIINSNDFEQSSSSSSFNYDPFDGLSSFLDQQQGMRLYDYFGSGAAGRGSPLINQCPLIDQLDLSHSHQSHHNLHHHQQHQLQQKNYPFQTDPSQDDDDDHLHGTLTSFVGDLGVESDAGYTSGVDLFAANTMVDCSDSTEAYYLRLALEHNTSNSSNTNICGYDDNNNYSDINSNYTNSSNNNNNYDCNISYNSSIIGDSNTSQTAKRSVLMNLLIDGSDVGAGYTSHNCRALPQRIQQHHQKQQ